MDERVKDEGKKALNKQIEKAKEKGSHWMKDAKGLSARSGEDETGSSILPSHISANLSAEQAFEAVVTNFSKISKEFIPGQLLEFGPVLRQEISQAPT